MLLRNLDLDVLRTLVTTHDVGGFAQATARLGRTPSAISLQMKRLQEELGTPLFRKHGRTLKLTEAGETALGYARRMLALNDELLETMQGATLAGTVRIGAPQDFAALLRVLHPVPAESLYEAAVEAMAAFRLGAFAEMTFGSAAQSRIRVKAPEEEHTVSLGKVLSWLDGGARSPSELVKKNRLKERLRS
jgi:Bacterial regulatory helix-turn-helix protein, lysR family